ncbi:hypothetical protein [Streptomyces viridochromogenes]|uniref:Secreted protein n=1 Tax=Streptomyces viridochromogenes Tue57 TaxID=1160705 RepID=L8PCK6_STRVR|nr:hypothetical protein [Streptomyces viridochromogenes]ELS53878.1 hypothetical protein STVIR_5192 [Streptomyces viridochromogenes Tue57]
MITSRKALKRASMRIVTVGAALGIALTVGTASAASAADHHSHHGHHHGHHHHHHHHHHHGGGGDGGDCDGLIILLCN